MAAKHRYVTSEPHIPFELDVLYEDAAIIVVDKPHFLATTPRGMWYRETALIRLREAYGESSITPAHRLDRATAGVLVFVRDPSLRGAYQMLFQERRAVKTYECLAPCAPVSRPRYGTVTRLEPPRPFPLMRRSHIVKDRGRLQAYEASGRVNAETVVERGDLHRPSHGDGGIMSCLVSHDGDGASRPTPHGGNGTSRPTRHDGDGAFCSTPHGGNDAARSTRHDGDGKSRSTRHGDNGYANGHVSVSRGHLGTRSVEPGPKLFARYILHPHTGKTHQLRVHMASMGLPIMGDDLYPDVVDRQYDDFSSPLQLVARRLTFVDPVTGEPREFVSRIPLG